LSNFLARHPGTITRDWKHFVDQGWTAIEKRTAQKEDAKHPNALLPFANEWLGEVGTAMSPQRSANELRDMLGPKLHSPLFKQNQSAEMAKSAKMLMKLFPQRMQRHVKVRCIEAQLMANVDVPIAKDIFFGLVCDSLLAPTADVDAKMGRARARWVVLARKSSIDDAKRDDTWKLIEHMVAEERQFLHTQRIVDERGQDVGSLLDDIVRPKNQDDEDENNTCNGKEAQTQAHADTEAQKTERPKKRSKKSDGSAKGESGSGDAHVDTASTTPEPTRILGWVFAYANSRYHCFLNVALKRLSQWAADWKERNPHDARAPVWSDANCRPKEFALFPSCKTKRRLVSYTWTQLKELLLFPLRCAVEVAVDKKSALVQDLKQQMQELHDASQRNGCGKWTRSSTGGRSRASGRSETTGTCAASRRMASSCASRSQRGVRRR